MERMHGILWHETIGSTNSEASRIASCADNLTVVAAKHQTAGRGQRGNSWSHSADDLAFSVILHPGEDGVPPLKAASQFAVCETVALSVTDYLRGKGACADIKWPNDIYCGDAKICGILIENTLRGDFVTSSVIGIGLNLNRTEFPENLPNPTSLRLQTGQVCTPEEELEKFMEIFRNRLEKIGGPSQRAEYESLMYRKDVPVRFIDMAGRASSAGSVPDGGSGGIFTGIIRGVSENGLLRVEMPDGRLREFAFKEISYIL